jgi:hypothetical protein
VIGRDVVFSLWAETAAGITALACLERNEIFSERVIRTYWYHWHLVGGEDRDSERTRLPFSTSYAEMPVWGGGGVYEAQ